MNKRPVIVISATRFFQGGTLVIVKECLKFLSEYYSATHTIKALVYKKALYEDDDVQGVEWVEFPKSRNSAFHRLYDEYINFYKLSKTWQPELWLSLQDSTPRVRATVKAVYYHNPLLLKPKALKLWKHQPRLEALRLLYKYIYTKGIVSNDFVITQQPVIAAYLLKTYRLETGKLKVFPPTDYLLKHKNSPDVDSKQGDTQTLKDINSSFQEADTKPYTFIFPATAFYYKNHTVIMEACRILQKQSPGLVYRVFLTIDGSENNYVKKLVANGRKDFPQVAFVGFLKREALFEYYMEADCMIFPSFLESWGLPLTEFAGLNKPILCANLPYGRSTLAGYDKAVFFDPTNANQLANLMIQATSHSLDFHPTKTTVEADFHYIRTWKECFELLLK